MKTQLLLFVAFMLSLLTVKAVDLPLTFESGTPDITDFDGGSLTVIDNPQQNGINTSAKVAQMVKNAGQPWAGSYITLDNPIDFSNGKTFKMKVFSPRVDAKVLLKVENLDNGAIAMEKEVATTVANEWEELSYNFSAINMAESYQKVVLIIDNGAMGDGSANFTFLLDDIMLVDEGSSSMLPSLPVDFESETIDYAFTGFDGGETTVVDNPNPSGLNTSAKVAKMVKNAGQPWGGSWFTLDTPVDFSMGKLIKMKFHSPRVDANVLFKLENISDGSIFFEKEVATTAANEWEELSFDLSAIDDTKSFQKIVLIVDNGTVGDGSENFTFYFDDIAQEAGGSGLSQIDLPVDFESDEIDYTLTDFGGNSSILGTDPANASNTVAITTKTAGAETWAGTTIGTNSGFATIIPFTTGKTKMSVKVYSPAANIPVRLKVEDHRDPTLTAETEAMTTEVNTWETLVFDFSTVAEGTNPFNPATNFDKASIFFNFGNAGADGVYYWDDIRLVNTTNTSFSKATNARIFAYDNVIFIEGNDIQSFTEINVFDSMGKLVLKQDIHSQNKQIYISENGIYIVQLKNTYTDKSLTKKIIIN